MISIAMTTYNGCKYIVEQLDSIRNQSLPPDEVIICDDKSSDNTVELINDYICRYDLAGWRVFINQQNIGYKNNFWQSILMTNGDFIFLADQDDIWIENKIEYMVKVMDATSALMLHTEVDIIDNNHKVLRRSLNKLDKGTHRIDIRCYMKKSHYCGMSSAMAGSIRELMRQLNTDNFPTHDWCLGFIAAMNDSFYTDNTVLSLRRSHGDNAALNMNATQRQGISQRIQTIDQYQALYIAALGIAMKIGQDSDIQNVINKFIRTNEVRKLSLNRRSVIKAFSNLRFLPWYPSLKAWVSDFMYIVGAF